ncbi:DUF4625 domain-containing protein [Sphingobacterium sp. JB170]|uniref:DUF4625 domain-containing protein n=1 Tax=Sphingobacterium sp. JB170 TaxID=1434842 RepID=UPI00097F18BB|nr:DUF4625 domain-containing protein [Sphingobacterium sp. JB170]SJN47813.1 hypothetical protein FM107_16265 [Sphingobacterium sp. JB170]
MKNSIHKKCSFFTAVALIFIQFSSCTKDDQTAVEVLPPTIENLEIGYGNNQQGIIGRDFHLDMDVVAGDRISDVQILIRQRTSESYAREWSFEVTWNEFKGVKNTNVHKHFDIDKEAPEGMYDFVIRVNDENGSMLEEVHPINLVNAQNLPADPEIYSFMLEKVGKGYIYILNRGYMLGDDKGFKKGEKLKAYVDISKVKDDGEIYTLLIKKNANHLPETVMDIDFSKVIVTDHRAHLEMNEIDYFTNYLGLPDNSPREFLVGADFDNNPESPVAIQGSNAWENDNYYFGVVYTNKTHNMSAFYYVEVNLTGF